MAEITASLLILGACSVLIATFLGGVVGFAYGLVALPLLLLIGVPLREVVVINLVLGLTTRLVVVGRRHGDINLRRASLLIGGSVPGLCAGVLVHELVSVRLIQICAGLLTIVAVCSLLTGIPRRRAGGGGAAACTAGGLGGFLGATTSLNGVPPALLLTSDKATARSLVADLAAYFVVGNALTLLALAVGGYSPQPESWRLLAAWVPVGLLGNFIGIALGPRLPQETFRYLTLTVIFVSGASSTIQALT